MKEKEALQLGVQELEKKLEMSELLLQQVRPESQGVGAPSIWGRRLQPGAGRFAFSFCSCHRILLQTLIKHLQIGPRPDLWN